MDRALDRCAAGEISLTRAADLAGVSIWRVIDDVADADEVWVSADHLEADLDEL